MSRTSKPVKVPYCKVCHDAGKPESEYTSHWVKDLTGKTICPTLLNQECRYCFKSGHTVKFCDVLLAKNKVNTETPQKASKPKVAPKTAAPKKRSSMFEALDYDSDIEEVEEVKAEVKAEVKEEVRERALTGWAAIAAKPKVEMEPKPTMISLKRQVKIAPKEEPIPAKEPIPAAKKPIQPVVFTKSWADLSDSEDDSEDDADYYYRSQTSLAKELIDDLDDW